MMPRTLYPHQKEAVKRFHGNDGRLGLFLPPGTGKTLAALEAARDIMQRHDAPASRILVVCEANKVKDWEEEGEEWLGGTPDVISYNKFIKSDHRRRTDWYSMLICDEAHAVKTPTAQRTQAVRSFLQANGAGPDGKGGIPRMFLTGTPFTKDPLDSFHIMKSMLIDVARMTEDEFMSKYCIFRPIRIPTKYGMKEIPKLVGTRDIEDFNNRVAPHVLRRTKDELLPDLPRLVVGRHRVALSMEEIQSLQNFTEGGASHAEAVRMLGLAKSPHVASHISEFIDAYKEECPVLVATHHRDVAVDIADRLRLVSKRKKRPIAVITGDTPADQRHGLIADTEAGLYQALVFTTATCGTGLNLQFASRLFVVETCLSPGVFVQLVNRIHRIGQDRTAHVEIATSTRYDQKRLEDIEARLSKMEEVIPAEEAVAA